MLVNYNDVVKLLTVYFRVVISLITKTFLLPCMLQFILLNVIVIIF